VARFPTAVLKLKAKKPAKKEAEVFYGREQEANTVYKLKHLNEHKY
jgi:hypothetical protein